MDDDAIREVLARMARPHATGGYVVERAAIMAEGADAAAILAWVEGCSAIPEAAATSGVRGGLYGSRFNDSATARSAKPARYILPAGSLTAHPHDGAATAL